MVPYRQRSGCVDNHTLIVRLITSQKSRFGTRGGQTHRREGGPNQALESGDVRVVTPVFMFSRTPCFTQYLSHLSYRRQNYSSPLKSTFVEKLFFIIPLQYFRQASTIMEIYCEIGCDISCNL